MTSSLVGSEMCIRDSHMCDTAHHGWTWPQVDLSSQDDLAGRDNRPAYSCLLYTSDAADDM
eukprot:7194189-Prorocentrum_lima.AAC.1